MRIDSGDLGEHAQRVRKILDEGELPSVKIFASGNLDEYMLRELFATAPIDGYGVGTRMNTSADKPYLDCAYKLQEYAGRARHKRSETKATWPGRKQVFRRHGTDGRFTGDVLTLAEDTQHGEALLHPVMHGGWRIEASPALAAIRDHAAQQLARLPERLRSLDAVLPYRVTVSEPLQVLARAVDQAQASAGD